jgi:manganese/zinc/iron transport system permease protein
MTPAAVSYNTLVVAAGVAAVGFAAGIVGSFGVLRRRALAGDAAAHATLAGAALAFLATGRRDLPVLLGGALVAALAALGALVAIRRCTRTRDDAATALVLGVSFGLGVALVSGITARGIPGGAGLEQFLLGHAAALTAADAALLACVSAVAAVVVLLGVKEATLVSFDPAFAAATGWPVAAVDYALVTLVALMVVVGLPAAGAVLVTALVVIPPVAARQWTDRVPTMLPLAGVFGLVSALAGVLLSAAVPRLATGPVVVLVAAAIFAASFLWAPRRGWLARRRDRRRVEQTWTRGRVLAAAAASGGGDFTADTVAARVGGDDAAARRRFAAAWEALVREESLVPAGGGLWTLSAAGRDRAADWLRRLRLWDAIVRTRPDDARGGLSIDLPEPVGADAGPEGPR